MEKGEGVDFATKYDVQAYPTFLYFNSEGKLVHRIVGAHNIENFITYGENAINPKTQFYTLEKRFENGERNEKFIKQIELKKSFNLLQNNLISIIYQK